MNWVTQKIPAPRGDGDRQANPTGGSTKNGTGFISPPDSPFARPASNRTLLAPVRTENRARYAGARSPTRD